jgi:hypothetical protein
VLHEHAASLSAATHANRSRRLIKCAKDSGHYLPVAITKGSIGQERRETCKQAEKKIQVGMVANSCSASARLRAAKGR